MGIKLNKKYKLLLTIFFFMLGLTFITNYLISTKYKKYFDTYAVDLKLKLLEDRDIDIVFFGSSNVHYGISASKLEEELVEEDKNIKVFNFGLPSASLLESSFVLEHLISIDKKPKVVVVPVSSVNGFKNSTDNSLYYGSVFLFNKYLTNSNIIELYLKYNLPLEYVFELFTIKYIKIYAFRAKIKSYFKNLILHKKIVYNEQNFKGSYNFVNYHGDLTALGVNPVENFKQTSKRMEEVAIRNLSLEPDFESMRGLNRFVDISKKYGIKLVLTYLPSQMDASVGSENIKKSIIETKKLAQQFADNHNISFIDSSIFMKNSPMTLTTDKFHLNHYSSHLISKSLSEKILMIVKEMSVDTVEMKTNQPEKDSISDFQDTYNFIKNKNLKKEKIDNKLILLYLESNDFIFKESIKNILLNATSHEVDMLIQKAFVEYAKANQYSNVRYSIILSYLSKIKLSSYQKELILDFLENSIKLDRKNRINAELLILDNMNHPRSKKILEKVFKEIKERGLYKNNLSYFLYAHNFIFLTPEYKELLTEHEQENILYFVNSGVIK